MNKINLTMILCFSLVFSGFAQSKLGIFDSTSDIGNPKTSGFASYNPEDQTYTIGGAGSNMWFQKDEFRYLWTTIQGDFILRAEAHFFGEGVNEHRKFGWIVKNNLEADGPNVNTAIHSDGLTSLQYRKEKGMDTEQVISPDSFPDVFQIERIGNTYIMSTAKFGEEFTSVEVTEMEMDNEVYVGLYVCSHDENILETAVFRNVRIVRPVDPDYTPYREYIGSHLEIMDVETGHRKILFSSGHSIQAPNWTVDGERLVYNSKGYLYNYHLKNGQVSPFNTGFANRNNNDHVFSFDGTLLGISHHNNADNGNSSLYYLPGEGSDKPIKVTKDGVGASYFHGWSPDNSKMLFTGNRGGQYDIIAIDINTRVEQKLTNEKTLDDGPEYSPDGEYIFFNSVRTGKMKLWRMKPDGSNPEQLTFDEYNDWFPHVSPDQKWIVFISFPKDIDPSDHPFYKRCLLRIMPFEGGTPRVIGYLYGGQGTINVPSWSPDSKKIAFVTNTQM